jgi:ABC-2 type transport system permease protein
MNLEGKSLGIWSAVWMLLRLRVVLWVSSFRRAKTRTKIGQIILILFFVGLGGGAFYLSTFLLGVMRRPEVAAMLDVSALVSMLPTLMLTVGFVITLATNFGVLLQALYLSRDMDFLIAAPIPMRAVFLSKLIQAILPNFGLFCLLALPVLFGLGVAKGYNPVFFPLLFLVMALFALMAAGLASILVMAIVRIVPARRIAEVLGFVGAIVGITFSQIGNLTRGMGFDQDQLAGVMRVFSELNQPWSPMAWAGRGLVDLGTGAWGSGILLTVLVLGLASAVFAGTLLLAERLYYSGWAGMQASGQKKKPARRTDSRPAGPVGVAKLIPGTIRALVMKDLLLMRRDLRNLSQLISPLILGFIFLFANTRQTSGPDTSWAAGMPDFSLYANIGFSLFVSWMLMFNLSTTSFSREGKNYWLLNVAPLKTGHLLTAKFIVAYLPSLIIGVLFLGIIYGVRSVPLATLPYALLVIAMLLGGLNGILLAFGVVAGRMDWEDPRRQGVQGFAGSSC